MAKELFVFIVLTALMHNTYAADCKKMPPRINPANCCPIPELFTEENTEKCKEFLIPPSPSPTFVPMSNENPPTSKGIKPSPTPAVQRTAAPLHLCFLNCALNDIGIFQDTGKINESNLSALFKKALKDTPEFIPEMEKSFKTCSNRIEKFQAKMQEKMKNRSTKDAKMEVNNRMYQQPPPSSICSPKVSHLMTCVFAETFVNCPAKYWSKSKECNELREHMKNCNPNQVNSMEDSSSHSSEETM